MSLVQRVSDFLRDNGPHKPDEMLPHFPGYSKKQLLDALGNGAVRDKCHVQERISRGDGTRGGLISIWAYGPAPKARPKVDTSVPLPPRGDFGIPKVASVFQLGGQIEA